MRIMSYFFSLASIFFAYVAAACLIHLANKNGKLVIDSLRLDDLQTVILVIFPMTLFAWMSHKISKTFRPKQKAIQVTFPGHSDDLLSGLARAQKRAKEIDNLAKQLETKSTHNNFKNGSNHDKHTH